MQQFETTPENETEYLRRMKAVRERTWPSGRARMPDYPLGERPLGEILRMRADSDPQKVAVSFYGRAVSYAELDKKSEQFANFLAQRGVQPGDRVAVFLQNCPQYFIVFYGLMKLGAVFVPVNPMFREAELQHELEVSETRVIIVLDQLLPVLRNIQGPVALDIVLTTAMTDFLPDVPEQPLPHALLEPRFPCEGTEDLLDVLERQDAVRRSLIPDLDAMAALNFTGGTTGLPKACIHTQRHMIYTAATGGKLCYELDGGAIVICFVPLFWIAGEGVGMIMPIFFGAGLVLQTRWDPVAFVKATEKYRATHVYMMVDNAMEILRREDCAGCDISSLKFVKTASFVNRITPELREAWRRRTGASLHEVSWGMTETHTYDFFTSGFQGDNRDLQYEGVFVGLPVPGTEVKICDFDTGVILAEGKSGEIVVRSPSVTRAYLEAGGTAVSALDEGGWFHTGDIGVVHSDGTMSYLGRSKELIKVKGMSVYPSELEVIIAQHPAVSQVAVVPRADPVYGQVPVAFVTFMSGSRTTREELAEWARGQFASYKQPEFRVIDVFPATFSGKIKKRELVSTYLPQEDK